MPSLDRVIRIVKDPVLAPPVDDPWLDPDCGFAPSTEDLERLLAWARRFEVAAGCSENERLHASHGKRGRSAK